MGQRFFEDNIGALSHSAGIIDLAASRLTIGGQQHSTGTLSRTISTDVTMTANTRYQIFAVVLSGVVALRISANENSVGPNGFSAWKLVGSFYANGASSVAFGSFVNINESPKTDLMSGGLITISAFVAAPTKGTTTFDIIRWARSGDSATIRAEYKQTSGGALTGSGDYFYSLPNGMQFDTSKVSLYNPGTVSTGLLVSPVGLGTVQIADGTTQWGVGQVIPYNSTSFRLYIINTNGTTTNRGMNGTTYFNLAGTMEFSFDFQAPISGWSNVPIKDL